MDKMKKCPECSNEVEEALETCNSCGYPFKGNEGGDLPTNDVENTQKLQEPIPTVIPESSEVQEVEPKKGFLLPILIGGVILVMGIMGIVLFPLLKGSRGSKAKSTYTSQAALVDEDGNLYFRNDKSVIEVKGDYIDGIQTGDKKHLIALEEDGKLVVYDGKGGKKVVVADEVTQVETVRNTGVVYSTEEEEEISVDDVLNAMAKEFTKDGITYEQVKEVFEERYSNSTVGNAQDFYKSIIGTSFKAEGVKKLYKYLFASKEATEIGVGEAVYADDSLSLLFVNQENVYLLPESASSLENISKVKEDVGVKLLGVSENGKLAVWEEDQDDTHMVYAAENGEKEKLADMGSTGDTYDKSNVSFINKGSEVLFTNTESDYMFRKKIGAEPIKINTGGSIYTWNMYSANNWLPEEDGKIEEFYAIIYQTSSYKEGTLYCFTPDGDREKILSDVKAVECVKNNKIFYIDDDDNLYMADLGKKEITNKEKISSDVYLAKCSADGKRLFFGKDLDTSDYTYTLYTCDVTKKSRDAQKLASDVYSYKITEDGKEAIYYKDVIEIKDSYSTYGELYRYEAGKDSKKISSDVQGVYSLQKGSYLDKGKFGFFKYTESSEGDEIVGDYAFYNGKEVETIKKDVLQSITGKN